MAWIVRIKVGKGKEKTVTQSTPLPNKQRVRAWVKRNPVGRADTKVKIINTSTKKTKTLTKLGAGSFGHKINFDTRLKKIKR